MCLLCMTKEVSFVAPHLRKRLRRATLGTVLGVAVLALSGCSAEGKNQFERLAMPAPRTVEAQSIYDLWHWAWLAAIIVGVLVWGLIGWAVIRYWRRSEAEVPVQTRYNLPIEILYTVAPVVIVIVFFFYTLKVQDDVLPADQGTPAHTIEVVGQQWSWTFNYVKDDAINGATVHEGGTTADAPTLWLPVDQKIRFNLYSPDVIHSFWVPSFLFKMDVIPGRDNNFSLTPDRVGTYAGKCAELCGVYHSRMLFNVKVVSEDGYAAHLADLQKQGNTGLAEGGSAGQRTARTEVRGRRHGVTAPAVGRAERVASTGFAPSRTLGQQVVRVLTTTDHKLIGKLYLGTSFAWFIVGGIMALLIRSELAFPGTQVVNDEVYNQLFTMHGTIMLLLFATPLFFGFGNVVMPLQIGSPDVAFPRLNMFSYWLFLFGGLIAAVRLPDPGGRRRLRLDRLHTAVQRRPVARDRRRPVDDGPVDGRPRHDPRRGQLHHHDHLHARARHDHVPDADLRLEHDGDQPAGADRVPDLRRRAALAGGRPQGRRARLRRRARWPDPVAAPVLVLRASRGLHHRVAVLRHHHRDPAGVQPQADLRLRRSRRRHARHRGPVGRRVGPPHVRDRCGQPAVLLRHDLPDRRTDRSEVLQLDRHDVGGKCCPWTPPCCGASAS